MAITNKIMKTFNVPNGSNTTCYEIVDDKGRKCIAKDWYANSTAKFDAGEYVIKDGVCYRFTTTHAANTSWSSSEVAATNLGAELSDVKSAFEEYDGTANLVPLTGHFWEIKNNKLFFNSYAGTTAFQKVRCRKGDEFVLKTFGTGTAPSYIIADESLNVLTSGAAAIFDGVVTVSDDDAYWIAVNVLNTKISYFEFYQSNINSQKILNTWINNLDDKLNGYVIPSENLIDITKLQSHTGYFSNTGVFTDSSNYTYYEMPVDPSTEYTISCFRHFLTFWDFSGSFAGYVGSSGTKNTNYTFTSPATARSMKVVFYNADDLGNRDKFVLVYGSTAPTEYIDPNPALNDEIIIPEYANVKNDVQLEYSPLFTPEFQMIAGGTIQDTTGEYVPGTSANLCCDILYYPMVDGAKYFFYTDALAYNVYFYDENKKYVEALTTNNSLLTARTKYVNSNNYKFFRVGGYKSGGVAGYTHTLHATMNYKPIKVVCLGDSMTAGNGASIAYHMYLANKTGWTCQNWGVGGAGWVHNMTTSTTVGNGVEGIAPSGVTPSYSTDFAHAIQEVPTDADLYIVFGGYNDWNTNQTQSDMETAVDSVLTYIQQNMASSRILVMTPPQRYKVNDKDGRTPNGAGLTLKQYGEIIKGVCELHAVPCIELYTQSGLYPYASANASKYYASDGVHPNGLGQKLIYDTMYSKAIQLVSQKN